jgi:hypothetical protein
MDDRTEGAALSRSLPVVMGGEPFELRTLSIDESDAWLMRVGAALAAVDLPEGSDGSDGVGLMLTASSSTVVGLVAAYDLDDVLGGEAAIRGRMSKRELRATMDAMVSAEDPFGEAVALSVATGFGLPSRFLASGMRVVLDQLEVPLLGGSTDGRSASASTTDASARNGRASSSSSAGTTRRKKPAAPTKRG